jgi:hypothetical protein
MESVQEAFLMLGVSDIDALQEWQLVGLIIHSYNLKNGLKCTGFDEGDPELKGK